MEYFGYIHNSGSKITLDRTTCKGKIHRPEPREKLNREKEVEEELPGYFGSQQE